MHRKRILPRLRSVPRLAHDVRCDIVIAQQRQPLDDQVAVALLVRRPVDTMPRIRDRHQHEERTMTVRSIRRIDD